MGEVIKAWERKLRNEGGNEGMRERRGREVEKEMGQWRLKTNMGGLRRRKSEGRGRKKKEMKGRQGGEGEGEGGDRGKK